MNGNKFKVILVLLSMALSIIFLMQPARAADLFQPPNSHAKILVKYFNRGQSFQFCWQQYDVLKQKFLKDKFCVVNDRGQQNISFDFGRSIAKVDAPEIVVRYNTLDRGLVDKTYPVAMNNSSGGAVLLNPEDKTDVVNLLINSRDIIVFYHVDGSTDYQMAYYPLPIRDSQGNVETVEVH